MNSLASFLAFLISAGTVSIATHPPPQPPPLRPCWTYEQAKIAHERWEAFDEELRRGLQLPRAKARFFYGDKGCVFWKDDADVTEDDLSKLRPAP